MKIVGNDLQLNGLNITFHRTLRLPEDGKVHALPPSLGAFPLRRVDDYKDKVPAAWRDHGGVFFPLYQREAMWISFNTARTPLAVKVAAGKVNAVSGTPWTETLTKLDRKNAGDPDQDYLVAPHQKWIDGFNVGDGVIRQFVAMPLGMKYTVEAQVTGEEKFGGLQLLAFAAKAGGPADKNLAHASARGVTKGMSLGGAGGQHVNSTYVTPGVYTNELLFDATPIGEIGLTNNDGESMQTMACAASPSEGTIEPSLMSAQLESAVRTNASRAPDGVMKGMTEHRLRRSAALPRAAEMGLAQGGQMKQAIYADSYGIEAWDADKSERVFVHIVNSELWKEITGEDAPATPVSAQAYAQAGLPWYDLYDEGVPAVAGSATLTDVKTIAALDKQHGFEGQQNDTAIAETNIHKQPILPQPADKEAVRDGKW